MILSNGQKIMV